MFWVKAKPRPSCLGKCIPAPFDSSAPPAVGVDCAGAKAFVVSRLAPGGAVWREGVVLLQQVLLVLSCCPWTATWPAELQRPVCRVCRGVSHSWWGPLSRRQVCSCGHGTPCPFIMRLCLKPSALQGLHLLEPPLLLSSYFSCQQ